MKAEVCEYCAGDNLERIKSILESKGHEVEVTGCIGLCAKYGCGRINVKIGEKEISVESLEEFKRTVEAL
ncbi:hypothetical protein PAP_08910 [Palaeococcus pacificus DY20341]|uniref:DUF1450 domain-containing protein n=1 Tax=Palaeococcus pacificus DY20341 TaxID=1343739 RepID=A0A075LVX9_9EURY|nr:hypothetical protein [Palaeococcus pacificus]AIF70162.1 hypothetical protein PAP_08910 [Palaeococcus pacificus DY20341]